MTNTLKASLKQENELKVSQPVQIVAKMKYEAVTNGLAKFASNDMHEFLKFTRSSQNFKNVRSNRLSRDEESSKSKMEISSFAVKRPRLGVAQGQRVLLKARSSRGCK